MSKGGYFDQFGHIEHGTACVTGIKLEGALYVTYTPTEMERHSTLPGACLWLARRWYSPFGEALEGGVRRAEPAGESYSEPAQYLIAGAGSYSVREAWDKLGQDEAYRRPLARLKAGEQYLIGGRVVQRIR